MGTEWKDEPDEDEYGDWCGYCEEWFIESHYHCANCNKVSGMMGHYSGLLPNNRVKFSCEAVNDRHH